MKMNVVRMVALALVGVFAVLAGGCSSPKMGVYNLNVTPDASLKDGGSGKLSQVEVALVGVKEADADDWRAYKVDSFFSGNDPFRAGAKEYTKTLTFSNDNPGMQTVRTSDPIWQVWRSRGVTRLFIFANSKNLRNTPGGPELRRKELPLTTDRWKTQTIDIIIKSSGIDVPTPMENPK
jgi:hypothetical protein